MAIVRSEVVSREAQADGREWVHEEHEDHLGVVRRYSYLGYQGQTAAQAAACTARGSLIAEALALAEIEENIGEVTGP